MATMTTRANTRETGGGDRTCCCGRHYQPEGGGESSHHCPIGQRNLCEECVSDDQCTAARIRCPPGSEPGPGGPDLVGMADRVSTTDVDRRAFKREIRILAATLPASIRGRRALFALVGPFNPLRRRWASSRTLTGSRTSRYLGIAGGATPLLAPNEVEIARVDEGSRRFA